MVHEQITDYGGIELALASSPADTASLQYIYGPTTINNDSDGTSRDGSNIHFHAEQANTYSPMPYGSELNLSENYIVDDTKVEYVGTPYTNISQNIYDIGNELSTGETATLTWNPTNATFSQSSLIPGGSNQSLAVVDSDGDLGANGLKLLEYTKSDENIVRDIGSVTGLGIEFAETGSSTLYLNSTPSNAKEFAEKLSILVSTDDDLGPLQWSNISLRPSDESRENGINNNIYLDIKDIDDKSLTGIHSQNQLLGASNRPGSDKSDDQYVYEFQSTSDWNFKQIYSQLREGESATYELDYLSLRNASGYLGNINRDSNVIEEPLKLVIYESNPNPTESSLNLDDLEFNIDSQIDFSDVIADADKLDKSFITSNIDFDDQNVYYNAGYQATIDGESFYLNVAADNNNYGGREPAENFNLPWNTLDMLQKTLEAGVDEVVFNRNSINLNVDSRITYEGYYAYQSNGTGNSNHYTPNDYEGSELIAPSLNTINQAPENITLNFEDISKLVEQYNSSSLIPESLTIGDFTATNDLLSLSNSLIDEETGSSVSQIALFGSNSSDESEGDSGYRLDIKAGSLSEIHDLESIEFTIELDPLLFEKISASDVTLSTDLPIENCIKIDDDAGTVTLSGASLSALSGGGSAINAEQIVASIDLSFDESYLETVSYNDVTGVLDIDPVSLSMSVNQDESIFSRDFIDASGQKDRDIQS